MATTTDLTPDFKKQTVYCDMSKDFSLYLNGQLVGFAETRDAGMAVLDAMVYELLRRGHGAPPIECHELARVMRADKAAGARMIVALSPQQRVRQAIAFASWLNEQYDINMTFDKVLNNWERGTARFLSSGEMVAA